MAHVLQLRYAWLGGDQIMIVVNNEGNEPVDDIRLRITFGSGDDRPWAVKRGIRGYEADGTLVVASESLHPRENVEILAVVPQQSPEQWTVWWTTADGTAEEATGPIEG